MGTRIKFSLMQLLSAVRGLLKTSIQVYKTLQKRLGLHSLFLRPRVR